ncbi:MAG TPA: PQQ-binding-like beta-propeller repeat protein [Phycisphaerae bacterium]|nr:PQQ-binding-like beta-propeller repeat protein [Phycisphaerae bacterium]
MHKRPLVRSLAVFLAMGVCTACLADDWPEWRGPARDGVWRETGIIKKFDKPQLDIVWRQKIASGYSGPTVANGRVYVTDRIVEPKQIERVHCFDVKTGKPLWSHTYDCPYKGVGYDAGPRASVLIDGGRAYSLGAMGLFICFDAASGKIIWQKDLNSEYKIRMPIWGISAAPLIEGDLIITQLGGEGDHCLVAFDKASGSERWHTLNDNASYSAPIVIEQAGRRIMVCYTGDNVVGVDPTNGRVHWKVPFPPKQMVIGIATPVHHNGMVFVSNFFDGSMLIKLDARKLAAEKVWHRVGESEKKTDGLHSIISTPYLAGDYIYGVDSYGELRCLKLMTGDRVWESDQAVPRERWATIHFVKHDDDVWMFNEKGELIISRLSPEGFEEISRAKLIKPTTPQLPSRRGGVCWAHPAFADRHVFARNDEEIVCASLSAL